MSFMMFPPEVNSSLMYSGAGSGPLMAAASAWDEVAADLESAAASYQAVLAQLTGTSWLGLTSSVRRMPPELPSTMLFSMVTSVRGVPVYSCIPPITGPVTGAGLTARMPSPSAPVTVKPSTVTLEASMVMPLYGFCPSTAPIGAPLSPLALMVADSPMSVSGVRTTTSSV